MKVLIIGNGLAGITCATNIWKLDDSMEIEIFSEEAYTYYSRVRLIDYMIGDLPLEEIIVHDKDWYEARGIKLHLNTRVIKVNASKNKITTVPVDKPKSKPVTHDYDFLVIASGSRPIIPKVPDNDNEPVKGLDRGGWYTLRTIDDANKIREELKQAERIIILGSGLLGLEIAHKLRAGNKAKETSIIEVEDMVAPVYLDKQGALVLNNLLERAGIRVLLETQVTELVGEKGFEGCRLSDKTIHKGGIVIFSTGIEPNVDFLEDSGIDVEDGIIINKYLQSSMKNVFAIGDCAEFDAFIYGINPAAIEQAKICAHNIVKPDGKMKEYAGTISTVTFRGFNTELVSMGQVNEYTIVDPESWGDIYSYYKVDLTMGVYKKILLKNHRVIGAILIGDISNQQELRRMIQEGIDVSGFEEDILHDGFRLSDYT